jgi:hypothetical protein
MSMSKNGNVVEITNYFAGGAPKREEMLAQPESCSCECGTCSCGSSKTRDEAQRDGKREANVKGQ